MVKGIKGEAGILNKILKKYLWRNSFSKVADLDLKNLVKDELCKCYIS